MPTQVSREINKQFEKLGSSYRFSHEAAQVTCEVIDIQSRKVYAKGVGASEEDAAAVAIEVAKGADRPKTYGELSAENAELRRQLEKVKPGAAGEVVLAVANPKPSKAVVDATESGGDDEEDAGTGQSPDTDLHRETVGGNELTAAEIVTILKQNKIEVPAGDRRTTEWRNAAMTLVKAIDSSKSDDSTE